MKVFVINLDSAKDRLAFISESLSKYGVEFIRVPGVVGSKLPKSSIFTSSGLLQLCHMGKYLPSGAKGCAFSHMAVWKRIVAEDLPFACILEDDVTVMPNIKKHLEYLDGKIEREDNSVFIISSGRDDLGDDFGLQTWDGGAFMCGYVVTNKAARFLIAANTPFVYPCDTWPVWRNWGLSTYSLVPRSVAHWNRARFGSTTAATKFNCRWRDAIHELIRKAIRLIGFPIDGLYKKIRRHRMIKRFGCMRRMVGREC